MVSRFFLFWSQKCLLVSQLCQISALMWLRLHLITVKKNKSSYVQLYAMGSLFIFQFFLASK